MAPDAEQEGSVNIFPWYQLPWSHHETDMSYRCCDANNETLLKSEAGTGNHNLVKSVRKNA